jgi:site-specific DNA-methyltransferase (adenine-specific)
MGTGTTALAAKALGRHFVGIDLDPHYNKIAGDKLKKTGETTFKNHYVSLYLGKIQSIRDIDAAKIFPSQLTSVEKKRLRKIKIADSLTEPVSALFA